MAANLLSQLYDIPFGVTYLTTKDRQMSKEEACSYLNLSRSSFDTYVRNGWIPKGKKTLGFKELSWTKQDLDIACEKIRKITGTFVKNN